MKALLPFLLLAAGSGAPAMAIDLVDYPRNFPYPFTPDAVVGDFNGDGHQDLVVVNASIPEDGTMVLRMFLGNGTTVFTPGAVVPTVCTHLMVTGDFTGDGFLDVVTADGGDCGYTEPFQLFLSLFRGDGSGGLQYLSSTLLVNGMELFDMVVGDVDGNGAPDIMGVSIYGRLMRFRYNPPGQQFFQESASAEFWAAHDSRMVLGDVDGDGHLDVVTSKRSYGSMSVHHGNGAGNFVLQEGCLFDQGSRTGGGVVIADLDGVGPPEIVVVSGGPEGLPPGSIDVFRRDASDPDPYCPWTRRTLEMTGEIFKNVVAADFDGDGWLDLATSGGAPGAPGQEAAAVVRVFPNDGAGWFDASTAFPIWESDHRLAIGDFNADSRPDLVAVGVNQPMLPGHAHVFFNGVPVPPYVRVTMATQPDRVTWMDAGADSYDVIYGDLRLLNATKGRFDSATLGCVANDLAALQIGAGAPDPAAGNGWFYLVRGNSPLGGTFDSGGRAQFGDRDQEIAASTLACP